MITDEPDLSLVIPFLDEERHIGRMLASLCRQELDGHRVEVLLADGGSTDATVLEVTRGLRHLPLGMSVRVIENPGGNAAAGFNAGIGIAKGWAIGIGGARTIYPVRFFASAIHQFASTGALAVGGGVSDLFPADDRLISRAIGCLYATRFGAGVGSHWRLREPGYSSSAYCAFYRREVFERVGLFNVNLVRGQDTEFNVRAAVAGVRIYCHPDLSAGYQFKGGYRALARRGISTGGAVGRAWKGNWRTVHLRHLAPLVLVAAMVGGGVLGLLSAPIRAATVAAIAMYVVVLTVAAIGLGKRVGMQVALLAVPMFVTYHFCYGVGLWFGVLSLRPMRAQSPSSH